MMKLIGEIHHELPETPTARIHGEIFYSSCNLSTNYNMRKVREINSWYVIEKCGVRAI